MAAPMPSEENEVGASDATEAQDVRRLAPRTFDALLAHVLQTRKIVQPRAADNSENRFGHLLRNLKLRFRAAERPQGLRQEP